MTIITFDRKLYFLGKNYFKYEIYKRSKSIPISRIELYFKTFAFVVTCFGRYKKLIRRDNFIEPSWQFIYIVKYRNKKLEDYISPYEK